MKILSGKFKGKSLVSFKDKSVRPTLGVVKEAVFNICRDVVQKCCFLDAFAGSGSMGFEALSRGAASATFIDSSIKSIKIIRSNAKLLQTEDQVIVLNKDVIAGFRRLQHQGRKFHIIYMDPPYVIADTFLEKVLLELVNTNLLESNARIFWKKLPLRKL